MVMGDYQTGGTRINSSGEKLVFTWDLGKYTWTFVHSELHMPELPVNDGYFKFHKLCSFLEKFKAIYK